MTMKPTPTPEMIEVAAEAIYNLFTYDEPGEKPKWVERGNSFKQEDARRYASAALSVPAAAVVGEQLRTMLEQAYKEGFEASGEGFNAEYHHDFETDNEWLADRDIAVSGLIDARPSAPDGWQPIETAPRNRTAIILALKGGRVTVGHWLDNSKTQWPWQGWSTDAGPMIEANVTHWQPLPSPLGGSHE